MKEREGEEILRKGASSCDATIHPGSRPVKAGSKRAARSDFQFLTGKLPVFAGIFHLGWEILLSRA
jgi:hypothetical protein